MTKAGCGDELFWRLAVRLMENPAIEEGKIMSSRCLRVNAQFMATVSRPSQQLVVKLNKARVDEMIGEGIGKPFAPSGRVFTAWIEIEGFDEERWIAALTEAAELGMG